MILVLGGARSGKSFFAEQLAKKIAKGKNVFYLATATPSDAEMKKRIEIHQKKRPKSWLTVEVDNSLPQVISTQKKGVLLVDCLTLYLHSIWEKFNGGQTSLGKSTESQAPKGKNPKYQISITKQGNRTKNFQRSVVFGQRSYNLESGIWDLEFEIIKHFLQVAKACKKYPGEVILVSNEVGMGIVPPYLSGRRFRELQGKINQILAQEAAEVYWMVAGIPVKIKP